MNAEEFMRTHAQNAVAGKIPEILADLTPEAMGQLGPLAAGGPNPATGYDVKPVSAGADDHVFDVTYTGAGDARVSMRETVRQLDGVWKIVKVEAPA